MVSDCSTMVIHSPQQPKVEGSCPAVAAGKGTDKIVEKKFFINEKMTSLSSDHWSKLWLTPS